MKKSFKEEKQSEQPRFPKLEPNAATIRAIKAARRGELTSVRSVDELLASLNEAEKK